MLGIGFIEISAIAGAIEIVVGVLKTRAPGMSLDKLPIYAWAMLVFAAMIVFGFPAIILGTALLEIERSFQWPFFIAEKGGDPLLWQHLFWFFGHPEVYIIFLPAAGFVSMIVPTMAQTPLVGYRFVVLALLTTGFIAFGVWVHHMFATGIPQLSISFFSAASMAVSIPAGIQLFAWIATIAKGRLVLNTPSYFVLGFLAIFTIGGLTGIMVGVVPFDWQVHDTYFVVAHFHYVLIGGMVFPLFAAFYYWAPVASARPLSEGVGRWVFWLMFVGFNLTFFPMHITGLLGMPRRVWTYPSELGWEWLNLTSTAGAFLLAAGVLLFLIDVVRRFRPFGEEDAGNVWNAGTLEWLPAGDHANRSIPIIKSREPLWDDPTLAQNVEAGRYYLAGTQTGGRETIVTTPIEARPQYVLQMPGPSLPTVLAAIFTAAFFLLLTVKMVIPAVACGIVAVACIVWWMWDSDPGPNHPSVDVGGGLILPVYMTGPASHAYWAMIVVMLVGGSTFAALVFSYFFLWTVSPDVWPAATGQRIPSLLWPLAGAGLLLASTALVRAGDRLLARSARLGQWPTRGVLLLAIPLLVGGLAVELYGQSQVGLRPEDSGYAAVVYMTSALQGVFVAVVSIMGLFTIARSLAGRLDAERRGTYENMLLLWYYTAGQGLVGLAMVHLAPRLLG